MAELHPFYEAHRPQMEEAMRQRLDLADPLLRKHLVSATPPVSGRRS